MSVKELAQWLRPRLSPNQLLLLVALYLTSTQNFSFWREVIGVLPQARGGQEYLFLGCLFVVLGSALLILLSLFSARFILKPALIVMVLIAATCSYFMDSFRVVIDEAMIINTVQTDTREASELLGIRFFLHLLLWGLIPALLIYRTQLSRNRFGREALRRMGLIAAAFAVLLGAVLLQYKSFTLWAREHREVRLYANPTYPVYSAYRHATRALRGAREFTLTRIGEDAALPHQDTGRPRVVILVVGEAARAANFQLNGYARATNPELSAINGLINYPQVYSCGTATAVSLPCLFSRAGHDGFSPDQALRQENLLDVLQRAGVGVLWRDNNSGCKGLCARVAAEDLSTVPGSPLCNADGCFDEILLHNLGQRLAKGGHDQFIVLHLKGSHGPAYYKRYPEAYRRFVPECAQDNIQTCPREHIINAYDNTLLYTDHVLGQLITLLKRREQQLDSVMIYASDHGESLGENGIYLHGLPYLLAPDVQKHIPMVIWFSQGAQSAQRLDLQCVAIRRLEEYSHDNLFDTVLGLLEVQTSIYRGDGDIFAPCRSE